MPRKTHLVGAWPGHSGAHAMETALTRLGPHLLRMTDGETGERSQWVKPTIDWMRANPDVELVRDADYTGLEDVPQFAVREGHRFLPEHIQLGYLRAFQQSYPAFKILRERHGRPDLDFQVGTPAPIDLAVDVFGFEAAMANPELAEAFKAATVEQIERVRAQAGDDVIFQVESVVALVGVAWAESEAQPSVAEQMAGALASLATAAPVGTRFGAHICLGDFHHKATGEASDARPMVLLANTLARAWPRDRPLEYIHAPFAAADKPPSFDEQWYAPLRDLDLPPDLRFVAGFIHESVDAERLKALLATIERLGGRQVDVAAACGLGRRPSPDQAWDAMDKAVSLVRD